MNAPGKVQDIAVGILCDVQRRFLLAQRRPGTYGAGLWEFPGGKHEPGETLPATLQRELEEEIGITPRATRPLIRMQHSPTGWPVRLHIWLVSRWHGTAYGREGQRVAWCSRAQLQALDLLPGNRAILNALYLPQYLAITPEVPGTIDSHRWWQTLEQVLTTAGLMLRLRAPALDDAAYEQLADRVVARARLAGVPVLLDRNPVLVERLGAAGLHWPSARARAATIRPVGRHCWFGVSAHDEEQLRTALALDADFAVLSPVHATASHPGREALGWQRWQQLRADTGLPVYALGGLTSDDLATAREHNAQGIAGIRAFWK